jgi:Uma2 family endonuclease
MGAKTLLSLEEFMALPDDGNKYELNQGELVVMPPTSLEHIRIVRRINRTLSRFVDERRLGEVYSEAGCLLFRDPERTYRQPDVAFLSLSRIEAMAPDTFLSGAPDLAVEVVSPSNFAHELNVKVEQYLAAEGREVWVVYPRTRSVHIYRPGRQVCVLHDSETITSDLFPGWSARVADFFDLDY